MSNDALKVLENLLRQVGKHKTCVLLLEEGLALSTADKLVRGKYPSQMKELVRLAIIRAASKVPQAS